MDTEQNAAMTNGTHTAPPKKQKKQKKQKKSLTVDEKKLKKASKKAKKQKKLQAEQAIAAEATTNKKKKDKKTNKTEQKVDPNSPDELARKKEKKAAKKLKKAKKKEAAANAKRKADDSSSTAKKRKTGSGTSEVETSERTMTDAEIKAYREKHEITLKGLNVDDIEPILNFEKTGFAPELLQCVANFDQPTPIQAQCWPALLDGRDVIGVAKTGSGKTLGFGLPGMMHVLELCKTKPLSRQNKGPFGLVIAPTRELAIQIQVVFEEAGAPCGVKSVCIYGGGDHNVRKQQSGALRQGVHFIVATPGRLLGYMREGVCSLSNVSYLVMDEADRMLDMGFEKDVRTICEATQQVGRQTLLFSATWPQDVRVLGNEFLSNRPMRIRIGKDSDELQANQDVSQKVEVLEYHQKNNRLLEILKDYHDGTNRIIIFVLYKKEVPLLVHLLSKNKYQPVGISSNDSQNVRISNLQSFKDGNRPLLVATDVAARGLDIPDVTHVINYSFPLRVEDYVHRIGRTGRGGKEGISHTFFTKDSRTLAGELVNVLNGAKAEVPEALLKFGVFTKRKEHSMYGNFYRKDDKPMKARTRMLL